MIIKELKDHINYLEELKRCHANTINSIHETYCISIAESIMNDQVIIAPRRCTFPELLGQDYPYFFNNEKDQFQIVDHILTKNIREYDHPEKSSLHISHHASWVYKELIETNRNDYSILENMREKKKTKIIKQEFYKPQYTIQELTKTLQSINLSSQSFTPKKIKHLMNELGYDYKKGTFVK